MCRPGAQGEGGRRKRSQPGRPSGRRGAQQEEPLVKPVLWLLLFVSTVAAVYVSTFAHYTGTMRVLAGVGTGVVFVGSALGLWLTSAKK